MVISSFPMPVSPHLHRWMMFVDGENFAIQAKRLAADEKIPLTEGKYYLSDVFVWFPELLGQGNFDTADKDAPSLELLPQAIRSFYYTSVIDDGVRLKQVRKSLRDLLFQPEVFPKPAKDRKTKAVDISIATDMLSHAYNDNYDTAILIAGDGDYVPLVREIKRTGKRVYVAFFADKRYGFSEELDVAADLALNVTKLFATKWQEYVKKSDEKGVIETIGANTVENSSGGSGLLS